MTYFLYTLPNTLKGSTGSFSSGVQHASNMPACASMGTPNERHRVLLGRAPPRRPPRRRGEDLKRYPRERVGTEDRSRWKGHSPPEGRAVDGTIHDAIASRSAREGWASRLASSIDCGQAPGRVAEPKLFILRVRRNSRSPNSRAFGKDASSRVAHNRGRTCHGGSAAGGRGCGGRDTPPVLERSVSQREGARSDGKPRRVAGMGGSHRVGKASRCLGPRAGLARHGRERSGSRGGVRGDAFR